MNVLRTRRRLRSNPKKQKAWKERSMRKQAQMAADPRVKLVTSLDCLRCGRYAEPHHVRAASELRLLDFDIPPVRDNDYIVPACDDLHYTITNNHRAWRQWEGFALIITDAIVTEKIRFIPEPVKAPPCCEVDVDEETARLAQIWKDIQEQ